jgi:putative addiction module component (TIGR02574 family)
MSLTEQIRHLSIPERVLLVQDIWDELLEETNEFPISAAQKIEIQRRLEADKTNPGEARAWAEIREEILGR